MRFAAPILATLLLAASLSPSLGAQVSRARADRPCEVVMTGRGPASQMLSVTTGTGAKHTYFGGGMSATCEGQGNRLLADSAEYYQDRAQLILFDNVRYTEGGMELNSDRMTYFTTEERLIAEGSVTARSASGTRFAGPRVEYFRDVPGLRALSRWVATGRPFVRMSPAEAGVDSVTPSVTDTAASSRAATSPANSSRRRASARLDTAQAAATRGDSVDLLADIVISENDSLMWATGKVVIERSDMRATADSAMLDNGIEFVRLMKEPVIVGQGERAFTLDGRVIDLWSKDRKLERVVAADSGRVVSDSLTLTSDTVDMRLKDQRMERVYAWGGRSRADAPAQQIDADSLDILMPGQRLREVRAIGNARATSSADTAKVVTDEPDWISGDTIIAQFDTVAVADSATQPRMREVLASGSARSLYQLAPSDGTRGAPNISYNRGRVIKVGFAEGEMDSVEVLDAASGLYLEPAPVDTTAARVGTRPAARPARPAPGAPRRP